MCHQPQTDDADKYDDDILMLMLMFMMVTLMLTPTMRVGILLERSRKGTRRDAGAAGSCYRKRIVAPSCKSRTRTNPLVGRVSCRLQLSHRLSLRSNGVTTRIVLPSYLYPHQQADSSNGPLEH